MFYAYGGDKIRSTCETHATYADLSYAETIAHLQAHFKQETTKLDALMFVATRTKSGLNICTNQLACRRTNVILWYS